MAILKGDVRLVASAVMDDVSEGGGAPTATIIQDGESNNIFPDISELDRAGGRVNLRKVHVHVQTGDRDTLLGTNFIVAEPPNDPNVSITVFSTGETFDTRTNAADFIEAYLVKGPALPGFLLENHVAGQRAIQLFQRPGSPLPAVGRTLVLVADEDTPDEIVQYVRTTRVESTIGTYTELVGGGLVDFEAEVVTCDISDALRVNFPGSPPSRLFAVADGKTKVRDTTVADAGSYHGVVALESAGAIGDATVQVESVYTQLVPNARTEVSALDQRPSAQRSLVLAETPRLVTVGAAPHSKRIKIGQENRGFNFVDILRPFPAANSLVVSFRALGSWYTIQDDGLGNLTGTGVGTVNYDNGSIAVTFPSMPDVGSSIIYSWGEKSAYTNRSAAIGFRMPELSWTVPHSPLEPGSVVVTWESGGVLKTATDNGTGGFTGDATGSITYNSGFISLKPLAMIDPGGEFNTEYAYTSARSESFAGLSPDAGGFVTITLSEPPLAGTITARWITVRNVSNSSGTSDLVSESSTEIEYNGAVIVDPPSSGGGGSTGGGGGGGGGSSTSYAWLECGNPQVLSGTAFNLTFDAGPGADGTYSWTTITLKGGGLGATSGTFTVSGGQGSFSVPTVSGWLVNSTHHVFVENPSSITVGQSVVLYNYNAGSWPVPNPSVPLTIKAPADVVRDPLVSGSATTGAVAVGGVYPGGIRDDNGATVYVNVIPSSLAGFGNVYDPPASGGAVWSSGDLTAGQKSLMSRDGVLKTYFLAGA